MEIINRELQNPHYNGEGFVFDNFSCELYKKRWLEAITFMVATQVIPIPQE